MRLSRVHVDAILAVQSRIELPSACSHYIKHVLRLKSGQQISLFNGQESCEYLAELEVGNKSVSARLLERIEGNLESTLQSTLLQAVGKPEHLDLLVQKATELGISHIQLFNSQRTQTHLKGSRLDKKMAHWQAIISNACEQCGRNKLPSLGFTSDLSQSLQSVPPGTNKLLLDFDGLPFKSIKEGFETGQGFSVLVGPEGGFNPQEIQLARDNGFEACILGPRVLRMETAAISIITILQHQFGDMG